MTQVAIETQAKTNESNLIESAKKFEGALGNISEKTGEASQAVVALGGVLPKGLTDQEILDVLACVHGETAPDKNDGTRVHIQYKSFGKPTAQAIACAKRAEELGCARDRYTGRVKRVWKTKVGEQCVTMMVELERDHLYRTFNFDRGQVFRFVVLGE